MDKSQAEAIAQALLQPERKAQEELRRKRSEHARWLLEKRKVAWLALAGFVAGAAVALFAGQRFAIGGLSGAFIGAAIGWLWIGVRHRRRVV